MYSMSVDDSRNKAEEIARSPLSEANLSARLIRSLARAGYATLKDAFDEDELEIKSIVGNSFSEFTKLVDSYFEDPALFVELMSQEKSKAEAGQPLICEAYLPKKTALPRKESSFQNRRAAFVERAALDSPHGRFLKDNQRKAREVFDDLCDRHQNVLVYQAFPSFSVELEEIRASFFKLFSEYPGKALDISRQRLPDLFLIFVADLARDSFSDNNLWDNFSEAFPRKLNSNVLGELKKLFVDLLALRGMPLYSQDEAAYYYFYSALLHGGLSEESWDALWDASLMPLAKELKAEGIGHGGELSGREILELFTMPDSRFSPGKESVVRILQKASSSTIAPLFESALKLALEVNSNAQAKNDFIIVENHGLPEAAILSLYTALDKRAHDSLKSINGRGKAGSKHYVSLPSAELCLSLERGCVLIKWAKKKYPIDLRGDKIAIFMDQRMLKEQHFEMRANQCILEDLEVEVPPQGRYDVEIRWMKHLDDGGYEFKGSLEQSFLRSKPGCFEFIRGIDGVFNLRGRNDRITRERRVAYVVKEGYYIVPGPGMTRVAEYETSQAWADNSVFLYDVAPGASGAIYKEVDGGENKEVAVWQESYRVHVNKHRIIGETLEGLDLYGYVHVKDAGNGGLPRIEIEAADGSAAFGDLEIIGLCDGVPFSVPRKILWEDAFGARIALPLERTFGINWHAKEVEIVACQKSADNKVIFRYRFAVIPLQEFRIEEAHVENGIVIARYSFKTRLNIKVQDSDGVETEVSARGYYSKRMLLKDEFMPLSIVSEDGSCKVNAKLALAALDITLPEELAALSRKRPICLADALTMGASKGEIIIRAFGWRYNRNLIVALKAGWAFSYTFLVKELHRPSTHSINIFAHPQSLVPTDSSIRDCPLTVFIDYGDEDTDAGPRLARTEAELVRCREGIGFKNCGIIHDGNHSILKFDKPVLCNANVSFRQEGRESVDLGDIALVKDSAELIIPENVSHEIKAQKRVIAVFSPKTRMGKVKLEYSFEVPLER